MFHGGGRTRSNVCERGAGLKNLDFSIVFLRALILLKKPWRYINHALTYLLTYLGRLHFEDLMVSWLPI